MRGRDQILRISRVGAAGMQGDVTGRGADAAVVVAGIVEGVGRHQQRFARPVGIRMLAVDFLEFLRGRLRILPLVHQVQALIVELVRGLLDEGVVLGQELVPQRAGAASAQGDREHNQARGQPQPPAKPVRSAPADILRNSRVIRCADINSRPDACDAVPAARMSAIMDAMIPVPVALVVQPRAYVPEKCPLTNRIRRHFARIKAAGMHRDQLWLLREMEPARRPKRLKSTFKRRPRGCSRHFEGQFRGIRKRRDRRPGRSCRPPCRCRLRLGRANGGRFRPRSPARRCDRPSGPSAPHG